MGKYNNAIKGGSDTKKGISLIILSCVGKAGDTGDVVHGFRDEVALLEEALSKMGTFSKITFTLCDMADCHLNNLIT